MSADNGSTIWIKATKIDGTVIYDELQSEGFSDGYIFFDGIRSIVGKKTENGDEILENIQFMYDNEIMDELIDTEEHPIRSIDAILELSTIEITEQIYGDIADGEKYDTATYVYDVVTNKYHKIKNKTNNPSHADNTDTDFNRDQVINYLIKKGIDKTSLDAMDDETLEGFLYGFLS